VADRGRSCHILVGNPQKIIGEEGGQPNTFLGHILARYVFFSRLPTCLQGDFYGLCLARQIVSYLGGRSSNNCRGQGERVEHFFGTYFGQVCIFFPSANLSTGGFLSPQCCSEGN
jgi:hypothetical protein